MDGQIINHYVKTKMHWMRRTDADLSWLFSTDQKSNEADGLGQANKAVYQSHY